MHKRKRRDGYDECNPWGNLLGETEIFSMLGGGGTIKGGKR